MVDDAAIDTLYGLPLDEFIPARSRLAKDLKAAGDKAGAQEVQSLRKPTVAAWAINQLVRREPAEVDELFDAVETLRTAQERALKGEGRRQLQEAGTRRRAAVDKLTGVAEEILEEAGHGASRSTLDGVTNSLLAVTTDPEAALLVRSGRLERELPPPSGFGDIPDMAVVLPLPDRRARRDRSAPTDRAEPATVRSAAEARAERRAAELAAQAEEAAGEAARRRAEADSAGTKARRLRDELAEAERLAARMNREAERAEKRAVDLRDRAERATRRG